MGEALVLLAVHVLLYGSWVGLLVMQWRRPTPDGWLAVWAGLVVVLLTELFLAGMLWDEDRGG